MGFKSLSSRIFVISGEVISHRHVASWPRSRPPDLPDEEVVNACIEVVSLDSRSGDASLATLQLRIVGVQDELELGELLGLAR